MKLPGAFLLALTLSAQPALRTELRNGVVRAVVLAQLRRPGHRRCARPARRNADRARPGLTEAAQI